MPRKLIDNEFENGRLMPVFHAHRGTLSIRLWNKCDGISTVTTAKKTYIMLAYLVAVAVYFLVCRAFTAAAPEHLNVLFVVQRELRNYYVAAAFLAPYPAYKAVYIITPFR